MRRGLTVLAAVGWTVTAFAVPAQAAVYSGGASPTIEGTLADLDGSGDIDSDDSWTAFYGDTDIVDGALDCDAWAGQNDGSAGDGTIDGSDDCTLIGYDGTADGVRIVVRDGHFVTADGAFIADGYQLPTVFNAATPDDADPVLADFAWFVHSGMVDANGNGYIDDGDCAVGIVGGGNILGVDCGFNPASSSADDGLVDVDGDQVVTTADDCAACFLGLAVADGLVQAPAVTHDRSISLKIRVRSRHNTMRVHGRVTSDGTDACVDDVVVRLRRRSAAGWSVVRSTTTNVRGRYSIRMTERRGRYRVFTPAIALSDTDTCAAATSAMERVRR